MNNFQLISVIWPEKKASGRHLLGYAFAVAGVAAAGWLRWVLSHTFGLEISPYITFYPAIILSALLGGISAGLLATVLSAGTVCYSFLQPPGNFWLESSSDRVGMVLFVGINLLLSMVGGTLRKAHYRAEEQARARAQTVRLLEAELMERKAAENALRQSEERYRTLFNAIDEGFCVVEILFDQEGKAFDLRYLQTNAAFNRLLHTGKAEGRTSREVAPGVDDHWFELFGNVALTGQPVHYEDRVAAWDRWFAGYAFPIGLPDSRQVGILFNDISERKRTNERLREEKLFSEAAINSLPGLFVLLDAEQRLLRWNQNLEEVSGFSSEEVSGMRALEFVAPEDRSLAAEKIRQVFSAGEAAAEIHLLRKDGRHIPFSFTGRRFEFGGTARVVVSGVDITERKEAEEALRQSELFHRQTLESIPGMLFTTRPDGYCDWQSPQWDEFTGVPMEKHMGDGWNLLLNPEDRPRALAAWRSAVAGRAPYDLEYRVRRHDGIYRWFRVCGRPIRDDDGRIVRWFGVLLDIEDLKRAEEGLQRQNQRLRILHQAAADLLVNREPAELLRGLHYQIAADFGAEIFLFYQSIADNGHLALRAWEGLSDEEKGKFETMHYGRAVCARPTEALNPIIATQIQTSALPNRRFVRKLGFQSYLYYPVVLAGQLKGTLAFASRSRPDYDAADLEFFQTIARLVTEALERKRLESEVQRHSAHLETLVRERTARLREAIADLEHMSYSMVHDMRAPLRAMQSFAMLLEEECKGRERTLNLDYFRRIRESADRLDRLLTDALNYNEVVRKELVMTPVELRKLLRGMLESYPNLQPETAEIRIEFDELTVLGNASLLTQCFGNMLSNAVKFVAPGVRPKVRVWAEESQDTENPPAASSVRVCVEDNGIGIPADAKQRIFRMFQRMHRESEYPGTGIGLTIVKKAVERMGGRVGFESESGQGCKFWVELRRAHAVQNAGPMRRAA